MTRALVLTMPDFQQSFVLEADASDQGMGTILI
jgi:hypothetical protein